MATVFRLQPMDALSDDVDPVERLFFLGPQDALADDILRVEDQGNLAHGMIPCVFLPAMATSQPVAFLYAIF
ncbi:hypothetical protein FB005_11895 [Sinorhizobium medicae]|uniref:hypothetical protein n=1 Tax=Sinorhizobium medicae TaxID=110321 RepID=UPI00119C6F81|nr:hypothetical protein [Sinorhizobium medicae]TWA18068.1 hypothetical protein FB006_12095 [Sinorhizobium medicae]TWA38388.1 hypothetical protein FB005_11895 [Sinorhizobium medicae]